MFKQKLKNWVNESSIGIVRGIALTPYGDIAYRHNYNTIMIRDSTNLAIKYALVTDQTGLFTVVFLLESNEFAIARNNYTINVFDLSSRDFKYDLKGHNLSVTCLILLRNGYLASGSHR